MRGGSSVMATKISWTQGDDGSLGEPWNPLRAVRKLDGPGDANTPAPAGYLHMGVLVRKIRRARFRSAETIVSPPAIRVAVTWLTPSPVSWSPRGHRVPPVLCGRLLRACARGRPPGSA